MNIELSEDQKSCFDNVIEWWKLKDPLLTMGGYAGCGKTTLISLLRNSLPTEIRIAFATYTGKASSVLRSKLQKLGMNKHPLDYCGTIHSLIYDPVEDESIGVLWELKDSLDYDLIIIDEASMISEDIFEDLKSFNLPILAVGDHGQLPPIEGSLNLMANPQIKLEKVHRFAEQNPLTKISMMARLDGYIPHGKYGDFIVKVPKKHSLITDFINNSGDFSNTAILCGFNSTRIKVNQRIREWFKRKENIPLVGERVICLKNNKTAIRCPIYNGILGTVKSCTSKFDYLKVNISIDGETKNYIGKISKTAFNNKSPDQREFINEETDAFGDDVDKIQRFLNSKSSVRKTFKRRYLDIFDFGYCLTVHKSQGSEWPRVMVIEEPCEYWAGELWNKWLYTAVTRSQNELLIIR